MLHSHVQIFSDAKWMECGRWVMEQFVAICCASCAPNDMRFQRHSLDELRYGRM